MKKVVKNMNDKINIHWYPGHMAKTKRLIKDNLKLIDIVYELIDARIPFSSKIKDIDQYLKNKPRLLIMTKADLADYQEVLKWEKHYQQLGYKVIIGNLLDSKNIKIILKITNQIMKPWLKDRLKKGFQRRAFRALVIGIPNVGKSTLINLLVGQRATKVGNKPGITKMLNWIRINKDLELLDSPGILWPKIDNQEQALKLASFMAIKEELLPLRDVSDYILKKMLDLYPLSFKKRYQLINSDLRDLNPIYKKIGLKRGCLIKDGVIDYYKVSSLIIKDLNEGKLGKVVFDRH